MQAGVRSRRATRLVRRAAGRAYTVDRLVNRLWDYPRHVATLTGVAIGYLGDPNALPDKYRQRDLSPRQRKPLTEIVFGSRWGEVSDQLK